MIRLASSVRIMVAFDPCDFRNGIDGIARLCQEVLLADPRSGYIFVFRNKASTSVKMLCYASGTYWLCQGRLSTGTYKYWPKPKIEDQRGLKMLTSDLAVLLSQGSASTGTGWKQTDGLSVKEDKNPQRFITGRDHDDRRRY